MGKIFYTINFKEIYNVIKLIVLTKIGLSLL